MKFIEKPPNVLILRMRKVPVIDATGIRTLQEVYKESTRRGTKLILSEIYSKQVLTELKASRLLFAIGKANVTSSFESAIARSEKIINDASAK